MVERFWRAIEFTAARCSSDNSASSDMPLYVRKFCAAAFKMKSHEAFAASLCALASACTSVMASHSWCSTDARTRSRSSADSGAEDAHPAPSRGARQLQSKEAVLLKCMRSSPPATAARVGLTSAHNLQSRVLEPAGKSKRCPRLCQVHALVRPHARSDSSAEPIGTPPSRRTRASHRCGSAECEPGDAGFGLNGTQLRQRLGRHPDPSAVPPEDPLLPQ